MSPSREGGGGARPSPLTIYKSSHFIGKAHSPEWQSWSNSAASGGKVNSRHHQRQQQRPMIIYTRSPKVIHTEPHDFMALVQKLTGMSRSSHDNTGGSSARPPAARSPPDCDSVKAAPAGSDDSSTTSTENAGVDEDAHGVRLSATAPDVSPPAALYGNPTTNQLVSPDVPIFTGTATARYYCSPRHFYYRAWPDVGFSPSQS